MSIEYIVSGKVCKNLGQAIGAMANVDSWKAKPRPKAAGSQRVNLASEATRSSGFTVVGFSPEHLQAAERRRNKAEEEARRLLGLDVFVEMPPPWDQEVYMRHARAPKARAKPFEIESAADQLAQMCVKAGWLCVRVERHLSRREDDLPSMWA